MPSNISQELVEVYGTADARGQLSQELVEVYAVGVARGQAAQLIIEVFMVPSTGGPDPRSGFVQGVSLSRQGRIVGRGLPPRGDYR